MNKGLNLEPLNKKFFSELIIDLLIFFVSIPSLLVFIYNSSLNTAFSLYTASPNIVTIYFSNFAHSDLNHLINNIITYLVIFFFIYSTQKLLSIRGRRDFYTEMALIYILVPVVVSIYNILKYPENSTNAFKGFSGIDSALIGYFVAISIIYIYKKANIDFVKILIYPLDISIKLLILYIFVYNIKIEIILILLIIFVILILLNKADIKNIYLNLNVGEKGGTIDKYMIPFLYISLGFLIYLLSVILWLNLFPANTLTESGDKINIGGHYIGYFMGIFIPCLGEYIKKLNSHLNNMEECRVLCKK